MILQNALELNDPGLLKAAYSLGNFWYAARQYDRAVECWETSAAICPDFPTVWRNLSLAYYNKQDDKAKALEALEKAFRLDENDSRILMELDQLYKRLGYSHERRLAFLEAHLSATEERDDLAIERITLYNQLGRYDEAKALIAGRKFLRGKVEKEKLPVSTCCARVELVRVALREQRYADALALLEETDQYPHNLGEGKLANA